MGRGNPERPIQPNAMVVRNFRSIESGKTTHRAMTLTEEFSLAAIKEILNQMVWGYNPGKVIAFIPKDSETGEPVVITSEDLVRLRHISEEDRIALLDIDSMRIKAAPAAVLIERIIT